MRDLNEEDESDSEDDDDIASDLPSDNFANTNSCFENSLNKSSNYRDPFIKNELNGLERVKGIDKEERLCSSLVHIPTYINHRGSNLVSHEVLNELSSRKSSYLSRLLQRYPKMMGLFIITSDSHSNSSSLKGLPINNNVKPAISSPINANTNTAITANANGNPNICKHLSRTPSKKQKDVAGNVGQDTCISGTHYLRNLKLQRGSITYRGAMLNIRRYKLKASSCPDIYRNSMVTIQDEEMVN